MPIKQEETVKLLLDIKFGGSKNEFEEFYGDSVSYQEIEQESYQDLKMMVEGEVGKVKFRKARDISGSYFLTCKLEMDQEQYNIFISIIEGREVHLKKTNDFIENPEGDIIYKKFKFLHEFIITNVRFQTEEELNGELLSDAYQKDKKTKTDFEVISLDEYGLDVEDVISEDNEEDYE
jgi:hypothetical protein